VNILVSILEQGLIFAIVSIGVYITYKILDFPDLSVDGSFPLGAAVLASCLMKNINPYTACTLAFLAGCGAGLVTGVLHVKFKITNLLSGILVMIGLYSIDLRIMTKSNIPLFNKSTIFTDNTNKLLIIAVFALSVKLILDLFLKTKLGFVLKAVGDNEQLVTSLAVNKDVVKVIGLMLSNGLVALAGAMMAQYQGFADVGMGTGTVVMGLAAVILGESVFGKLGIIKATTAAMLGSIIYRAAVAGTLELGLAPTDLKLVTSIIVIAALSLNNKKFNLKFRKTHLLEVR
jgi:putative tryptophan/tyrosine transport system permease protein